MPDSDSPFLEIPPSEWLASNSSAFAITDRFPVSPGHALVVPRRLIGTWWEATEVERVDMLALVDEVKHQLDAARHPDGFNVGFNDGEAAGQAVGHLHLHVIPRYDGDVPDPRGGVRHVIPSIGNYLESSAGSRGLIDGQSRLLRDELLRCLRDPRFDNVDVLVSFVMKSGLELIYGGLLDALDRGAKVRVLTTDYLTVTDADAMARLLDLSELRPEAIATRVFHDPATSFHPKAYLFSSAASSVAETFVGSNNLSAAPRGRSKLPRDYRPLLAGLSAGAHCYAQPYGWRRPPGTVFRQPGSSLNQPEPRNTKIAVASAAASS